MARKKATIKLPTVDSLFTSQEERESEDSERVALLPVDAVEPFPGHPFHVSDDEEMARLAESVAANGVLVPLTVRPLGAGRYGLVSGHRRKRAAELAVLSEFSREPPANVESEPEALEEGGRADGPEKAQIVARTGKSVSGKATSGKPVPINYSSDKGPHDDKKPPSCPPGAAAAGEDEGFAPYRKGEFPEAFERLCAMSIKPVASLRFKRDCLAAWERRVAEGFSPEQIVDAYAAYAKSYWLRNGDDPALAKNLARWIEGEGGLSAYSDEPIPPDLLDVDGGPLDMVGLAQADPEFAKLWRRVETRRAVVRSQLYAVDHGTPETEVMKACEKDAHYARYLQACQERYDRYLKVLDLFRGRRREGTEPLWKEGDGMRTAWRFVKWLFRAVFRFM